MKESQNENHHISVFTLRGHDMSSCGKCDFWSLEARIFKFVRLRLHSDNLSLPTKTEPCLLVETSV